MNWFKKLLGLREPSPEEVAQAKADAIEKAAKAIFQRSRSRLFAGDERGSIAELTSGIDSGVFTGQNLALALLSRGASRTRLKDNPGAMADFDAIAAMSGVPDLVLCKALLFLGRLKSATGDHQRALESLNAALGTCGTTSDKAKALVARGRIRCQLGDLCNAKSDFEEALRPGRQDDEDPSTSRHATEGLEEVQRKLRESGGE